MKYSKSFNRDYTFYLKNKNKFWFCGIDVQIPFDENGETAKKAFWELDARGKKVPCKEPEELKSIIICKKSVNLQIKEWVEGYNDCYEKVEEYLKEFIDPPDWIEKSFRHQLNQNQSIFGTVDECLKELNQGNLMEISTKNSIPGHVLFKWVKEQELPLDKILFLFVIKQKMLVEWTSYIQAGKEAGWKLEKILSLIIFACRDSGYGKEYLRANFEYKEEH